MRRISLLLEVMLLCLCSQSFSQSVDLLTGRLQMSVALGQIQANDISIPISAYHHGSTLQVAEGENDAGLGWGLSVGGSISCIVRGLPDYENSTNRKGWKVNNNAQTIQSFVPSADDDLSNCSDEASDWNFLNSLVSKYVNDTEPDLFFINAPGLSVQFVFGADGNPKPLSHQDISIQFMPDSVVVKPNNGLIYVFKGVDIIERWGVMKDSTGINTISRYFVPAGPHFLPLSFASKRHLSSITSTVTGTRATFNYAIVGGAAGRHYLDKDSLNFYTDVFVKITPEGYQRRNEKHELTSVTVKSYTARFNWMNSLIQSIVFSEANSTDKKEVTFEYIGISQVGQHIWKSLLSKIHMNGGGCLPKETYSFEYQNIQKLSGTKPTHVDWKKYWGQDFFGYPNGDAANKNLPTIYAYYGESNGRRLRVTPIPGVTASATISAHNRTPNVTSYGYGALTKVTLPTGGYTEIQYEPNYYIDNSTNEEFQGPGARVKKIITQGGEIAFGKNIDAGNNYRALIKEYEYRNAANTQSSGLLVTPINLAYVTRTQIRRAVENMAEAPKVMYARVKEKVSGQGFTVHEFSVPGVFPQTSWADWKASKSRIARKPGGTCVSAGNIKNGYYTFPFPRSTNYDFARGQLTKISEYSETGTLVREKTFGYGRRTNNPATLKAIRFERIDGIYHYGVYEILTGHGEELTNEVVREASHEDPSKWNESSTLYVYNSNNMLQSVNSTLQDGTYITKTFKYAKDFPFTSPPSTDTVAVAIKALNDNNRGTELIEQVTKVTQPGSPQTVTEAQLITYKDFGNGRIFPHFIKTFPQGLTHTDASMSGQNFLADSDYITVKTIKEYDAEGRILTVVDNMRNYSATHYATGPSIPIASFANIKAQQAVYENFEMVSSFGLLANGADFQYPAGWTGEKAIRFTSNTSKLASSFTEPVQKNGNKYRVSCWVNSALNKTITFYVKNGTTTLTSLTLTNPVGNKWNYLEAEVDMSSVTGTFTLEVLTNATIAEPVSIDDILFMPIHGMVSMQTVLPLKGVTSSTDDRGNSVKYTYDPMGRLITTSDRNRNLVLKNDYVVKNTTPAEPYPSFAADTEQFFMNTPVTFTPVLWSCDGGTSYAWEVDGVPQASASGNVLVHTFTTPGRHVIKLTASSGNVSKAITREVCVEYVLTGSFTVMITDENGEQISSFDCNNVPQQINYNVVPPGGFPPDCTVTVAWINTYEPDGNGGTIIHYNATYEVSCSTFKDCPFSSQSIYNGQASSSITQLYNPNCQ